MAIDYYQELSVARGASEKDIKAAFRKLARQFHPDVNAGNPDAEARFKRINEAYEVLGDDANRKKYDKYGENWVHADDIEKMQRERGARAENWNFDWGSPSGQSAGTGGQSYTFRSNPGAGPTGADIFGDLFGNSPGGGRASTSQRPRTGKIRGDDLDYGVTVSLPEAFNGTSRLVQLGDSRIEVKIPAGVTNGSRVRIAGKGGPGFNGGEPGDLHLVVAVESNQTFEVDGDDLYVEVPVMAADAALGGEVAVPLPNGKRAMLKIPAETQAGRQFKLTAKGMSRIGGGGQGDLYARIVITIPTDLTDRERDLFRELQAIRGWQR